MEGAVAPLVVHQGVTVFCNSRNDVAYEDDVIAAIVRRGESAIEVGQGATYDRRARHTELAWNTGEFIGNADSVPGDP